MALRPGGFFDVRLETLPDPERRAYLGDRLAALVGSSDVAAVADVSHGRRSKQKNAGQSRLLRVRLLQQLAHRHRRKTLLFQPGEDARERLGGVEAGVVDVHDDDRAGLHPIEHVFGDVIAEG